MYVLNFCLHITLKLRASNLCLLEIQMHIHKHLQNISTEWTKRKKSNHRLYIRWMCDWCYVKRLLSWTLPTSSEICCLSAKCAVYTRNEVTAGRMKEIIRDRERERERHTSNEYCWLQHIHSKQSSACRQKPFSLSLSLFCPLLFSVFISLRVLLTRITLLQLVLLSVLLSLLLLLLLLTSVVDIVEFVYWKRKKNKCETESVTHWLYLLHWWWES